jgi:hypothetical protein
MKTHRNDKSDLNGIQLSKTDAVDIRPHATKTLERRCERRKLHEQLRRLDWARNVEDEIFA